MNKCGITFHPSDKLVMCVYLAGKSTNRKTQHKEEKLIRLIITQGILHPKELR